MIGLHRRARTFASMGWGARRRYYAFRLRTAIRRLWHAPIRFVYFPIALILAWRNIRVIGSRPGAPRIGHLAWELHFYVKAHRLGIWGPEKPILLASRDLVANTSLRDYWRDHVTVISNPIISLLMRPLGWGGRTRRNLYPIDVSLTLENGSVLSGLPAFDYVHERYKNEIGSDPLMELQSEHRERCMDTLHDLGMPRDAWFLALHVREPGFLGPNEVRQPRDGDISDYTEAISLITARGGWVVRLGNRSMTPLPPMPNVIDYVFSDAHSPEMDIFLLAQCRFFLGTDSGPVEVPPLFGKPCAIVARVPICDGSHYADDIYLPNTYRSEIDARMLSFSEIMNSEVGGHITNAEFSRSNVAVISPTAAEIAAITGEMIERLDGNARYDELDRSLQERWRLHMFANVTLMTRGVLSSVSRDYLRRNRELLDDNVLHDGPTPTARSGQ